MSISPKRLEKLRSIIVYPFLTRISEAISSPFSEELFWFVGFIRTSAGSSKNKVNFCGRLGSCIVKLCPSNTFRTLFTTTIFSIDGEFYWKYFSIPTPASPILLTVKVFPGFLPLILSTMPSNIDSRFLSPSLIFGVLGCGPQHQIPPL